MKALETRIPDTPEAQAEAAVQRQILQLATSLRAARVSRNWSQAELERRSGVPQADISRIENGLLVQGPTTTTLCRLANALEMQLSLQPTDLIPVTVEGETAEPNSVSNADFETVRRGLREELAAFGVVLLEAQRRAARARTYPGRTAAKAGTSLQQDVFNRMTRLEDLMRDFEKCSSR